ncbi:MAG: hypothetical protein COA94_08365 [Rickettsiales bacterium]|nr:MAG: hypothetical protein COA94_08365 [Rickettsiales bacterium]
MLVLVVTLSLLSVIAISLLIILFGNISKKTDTDVSDNVTLIENERTGWGILSDLPNGLRNECNSYTFGALSDDEYGKFTLDVETLNRLVPTLISEDVCIDSGQIAAKQQIRECIGKDNDPCVDSEGKVFVKGQKEILYVPCEAKRCKGTLSLISLNFDAKDPSNSSCIYDLSGTAISTKCSLLDESQLILVERTNNKELKENDNGIYAKFLDRFNGKCIVPLDEIPVIGTKIGLGECKQNSGYVWLLIPPTNIDGEMTSQQIVYTSTLENGPKLGNFRDFVSANELLSLNADGDIITLEKFNTSSGQSSQILDYRLYNILNGKQSDGNVDYPYYKFS